MMFSFLNFDIKMTFFFSFVLQALGPLQKSFSSPLLLLLSSLLLTVTKQETHFF